MYDRHSSMASWSGLTSRLCAVVLSGLLLHVSSTSAVAETTMYPITQISDGQIQAPTGVGSASLVLTYTPEASVAAATATLSSIPASLVSAIPSSNVTLTAAPLTSGPVPTSIVLASAPPQIAGVNLTGPIYAPPIPAAPTASVPTTLATVPSAVDVAGPTPTGTATSPVETGEEAASVSSELASYTGPAATGAAHRQAVPLLLRTAGLLIVAWWMMG